MFGLSADSVRLMVAIVLLVVVLRVGSRLHLWRFFSSWLRRG